MILQPQHFRTITLQNFHFFRDDNAPTLVKETLSRIALEANFYIGVLDGNTIRDQEDLLSKLWSTLNFPDLSGGKNYKWDSAADWLGDLSWLEDYAGVIVLYTDPVVLFERQADIFGQLLDIVGERSIGHINYAFPFHFVSGPLNQRMVTFLNILAIRERICAECLYGHPWPFER